MIRLTPVERRGDAERAGSELNRTGRALATTEQHAAYESGLDEVEAGRFVGARVARKEDPRFLTGRGLYTDDVALPGMLHVAFVRSPHARAAITGIDTTEAAAMAGVIAVYTFDDLAAAADAAALNAGPLGSRPVARDVVCFVGDPVVLVVAESRALAEDACELVDVEYEPRPAVIDLWLAVDDDNELVHEELESNVARTTTSPDDPALGRGVRGRRPRGDRHDPPAALHRGADGDPWRGRELGSGPRQHVDLDLESGRARCPGPLREHPRASRREGARDRARRRRRVRPEDQRGPRGDRARARGAPARPSGEVVGGPLREPRGRAALARRGGGGVDRARCRRHVPRDAGRAHRRPRRVLGRRRRRQHPAFPSRPVQGGEGRRVEHECDHQHLAPRRLPRPVDVRDDRA